MDELIAAYNDSKTLCMMVQEFIDWEAYVRCVCIGKNEINPLPWDPSLPHHERYAKASFEVEPAVMAKIVDQAKALAMWAADAVDYINAAANGEMEIELFYADQIVPTGELFQAMQRGTIDMVHSDDDSMASPTPLQQFGGYFPFATKHILDVPVLFNQYAYIPVNPEKHAHVNKDAAAQLEDWLVGDRAKVAELCHGLRQQEPRCVGVTRTSGLQVTQRREPPGVTGQLVFPLTQVVSARFPLDPQ